MSLEPAGNDRRNGLPPASRAVTKGESAVAEAQFLTIEQRVAETLVTLQQALGGKELSYRLGISNPQLSRLIGGARKIGVEHLPRLIAMDPDLGAWLIRSIPVWMGPPKRLVIEEGVGGRQIGHWESVGENGR